MSYPLATRIANDYLKYNLVPEVVTVYPAPRNDATKFLISYAERFPLTERDLIQGNGAYTSQDRVWYAWQSEIVNAATPPQPSTFAFKPGDVISAGDSTEWTVLQISDYEEVDGSWRLMTRDLVLHFGLRDSVTILRPVISQGPASEPVYDYYRASRLVTNCPARVQPKQGGPKTVNEFSSNVNDYTVVLGQQVSLQRDDIIQAMIATGDNAGLVINLKWKEQNNQERIDELPYLTCERV